MAGVAAATRSSRCDARIAGGRSRGTFGSLGLLFPLATRALPMLLLFVTFLFINTEVWQVPRRLDGGVLWLSRAVLRARGRGFLLVRLDEELDQFDDDIDVDELPSTRAGHAAGAPLRAGSSRRARTSQADAEVTGLQKANLVLVLLVSQAVQVLLLAFAVFCFFVVFGVVAIEDEVITTGSGTGTPSTRGRPTW